MLMKLTYNIRCNINTEPRSNGRRWPGLMKHFPFTSCGLPGALTWGSDGTRMLYGRKISWKRQCYALDDDIMGNYVSCHSWTCFTVTLKWYSVKTMNPNIKNGLSNTTMLLRCWLGLRSLQIFNKTSAGCVMQVWSPNVQEMYRICYWWPGAR